MSLALFSVLISWNVIIICTYMYLYVLIRTYIMERDYKFSVKNDCDQFNIILGCLLISPHRSACKCWEFLALGSTSAP